MLSKCANPDCSKPFLYLRRGKLFRFEIPILREEAPGNAQENRGIRYRHEYFWLCDHCSAHMTVVCDNGRRVRTIPLTAYKAAS